MEKVHQPWRVTARRIVRRLWRDWGAAVLFIVFVLVPVKSSLADWNWVPSGSMNPTILEGDLIYVNKLAYDLRVPLTLHRLASWSEPRQGDAAQDERDGHLDLPCRKRRAESARRVARV